MRINAINNTTFNGCIKVPNVDGQPKYLYNHVSDIMKENKLSGMVSNDGITLNTLKESVMEQLTKLKIKFIKEK